MATISSLFSMQGLNLNMYDPPWKGGAWVSTLTETVKSYSHDIASFGGFNTASITLENQPIGTLEDWVESGLGREMRVSEGSGFIAFEGFIDRLEFTIGGFTMTVGPFMDIVNVVALLYSIIDYSTGSAITGLRGMSDWLRDELSVAKYGEHVRLLSSGGIEVALVPDVLALALDKLKAPAKSENITFGKEGQSFNVRIDLLGWYNFFQKYTYNNTATTAVNASDKLTTIVNAQPNSLFDATGIKPNTLQVSSYENDDAIAWGIIKALVSLGDSSNNRYLFGVYEHREVRYTPISSAIQYYRPMSEKLLTVLDTTGNLVPPWQVRPGGWAAITDLTPTKKLSVDATNAEIGSIFIESVSFQAPDQLTLNGSQSFKLDQRLAQLGISGLGI